MLPNRTFPEKVSGRCVCVCKQWLVTDLPVATTLPAGGPNFFALTVRALPAGWAHGSGTDLGGELRPPAPRHTPHRPSVTHRATRNIVDRCKRAGRLFEQTGRTRTKGVDRFSPGTRNRRVGQSMLVVSSFRTKSSRESATLHPPDGVARNESHCGVVLTERYSRTLTARAGEGAAIRIIPKCPQS